MDRIEYLENLEELFSKTIVVMAKRKDFGDRFMQVIKLRYEAFLEVEELRNTNNQSTDEKTYLQRLKDHIEVAFMLTLTQEDNEEEKKDALLKISKSIDEEIAKHN